VVHRSWHGLTSPYPVVSLLEVCQHTTVLDLNEVEVAAEDVNGRARNKAACMEFGKTGASL